MSHCKVTCAWQALCCLQDVGVTILPFAKHPVRCAAGATELYNTSFLTPEREKSPNSKQEAEQLNGSAEARVRAR